MSFPLLASHLVGRRRRRRPRRSCARCSHAGAACPAAVRARERRRDAKPQSGTAPEPSPLMDGLALHKSSSQHVVLQVLAEGNPERSNAAEWSGPQLAVRCGQLCGTAALRQSVSYCLRSTLAPKGLVASRKEGHKLLLWGLTEEVRARSRSRLGLRAPYLTHHAGPTRGRGAGDGRGRRAGAHRARAQESASLRASWAAMWQRVGLGAALRMRALWASTATCAALPRRDVRTGRHRHRSRISGCAVSGIALMRCMAALVHAKQRVLPARAAPAAGVGGMRRAS